MVDDKPGGSGEQHLQLGNGRGGDEQHIELRHDEVKDEQQLQLGIGGVGGDQDSQLGHDEVAGLVVVEGQLVQLFLVVQTGCTPVSTREVYLRLMWLTFLKHMEKKNSG